MNSTCYVITVRNLALGFHYCDFNVHVGHHSSSCIKSYAVVTLKVQQVCCTTPGILAMYTR